VSKTGGAGAFHTLRGLLSGSESEENIYFAYSATLRIFGDIADLDGITEHLGVLPTSSHRRGDRRGPNSPPFKQDMWSYTAPVKENEPLHVHIDALWNTFKERRQYLLQLKQGLKVDVFLGYRSNCDHAGIEVPHQSLEIFRELQVPFGLSIIVA
jgi:Domain of unknown function (DUF4279)